MPTTRVRLFAALREMAGSSSVEATGATVSEVIEDLAGRYGERFGDIARSGTAVVDGERAEFDARIEGEEEVALLPPVSGGGGGLEAASPADAESPRGRPERVLLVANPVARTVSRPMLDVIEKAHSADFKLEVDETTGRGHATELARQAVADDFDMLVVFSGDGTVNEAVNGLAGSKVMLGVIPGGATNVFARALGIPQNPIEATAVLMSRSQLGTRKRIHLGRTDDRFFAFNCGIGIDAEAMARVDERRAKSKKEFERAALIAVVRAALFRYAGRRPHLEVRIDGGEPIDAVSVMTGRTNPYTFFKGAGVRLTPRASLETGLDVLVVKSLARRSAPRVTRQVFTGRVAERKNVAYFHDAERVEIVGRERFPVQVDGDFLGPHERLTVELARDALWVCA